MTSFEDDYLDVLQNIEFAIVQVYHSNQTLMDYEVEKALNNLIQTYKRPNREPKLHSNRLADEVYGAVKAMCDWRLGSDLLVSTDGLALPTDIDPLTVDEIVACLKRIRKSVRTWNKRGGRQGYLKFIEQYVS